MSVKLVQNVVRGRRLPLAGRSVPMPAAVLLAAMMACIALSPSVAAAKKPSDWQNGTTVESQAATAAEPAVCQQISSNISKRVASIKALQASIANSAAGPPSSVKSALEDMFGTRQPDAKTRDLERKIKVERKAADDLNDMMQSSQCTPVDIDAVLAKHKLDDRAAPEVPKAMPDDLVRAPHRY